MSKASPEVLRNLSQWQAEQIDQTVERVRLALAAGHVERAIRVIDQWQLTSQESPPLEATGMDPTSCSRLRRRGITSVSELRTSAKTLSEASEISPTLRKRIVSVLQSVP